MLFPFFLGAAEPRKTCLREPRYDSILTAALQAMYHGDYASADSQLVAGLPARSRPQSYFRGLVLCNRFSDLGDTAALARAAALWESILASDDGNSGDEGALYAGLSELQLSYVATLEGRTLRAATLGRKANGRLRALAGYAEADAALALYDYYKASLLKGVSWLPFVRADIEGPLHRVESAVPRSRYLREVLENSLLWLYYDGGRYDSGLVRIERFLGRYPGNRLSRQMQADFHFRMRDLEKARGLQEGLKEEYLRIQGAHASPAGLPIGYLCAVGNLAKIYAAMGRSDLCKKQLSEWSAPEYREVLPWLPASLRREVKALAN